MRERERETRGAGETEREREGGHLMRIALRHHSLQHSWYIYSLPGGQLIHLRKEGAESEKRCRDRGERKISFRVTQTTEQYIYQEDRWQVTNPSVR